MAHSLEGVDFSQPVPGIYEELDCGVCGRRMDVERNIRGPRSFVEGMAGATVLHDVFECPKRKEKWHQQAKALFKLAKETPSGTLEQIYTKEMEIVLGEEKPTKENWGKLT
jgi:hypothetical protein